MFAKETATRDSLIAAAVEACGDETTFEKDGFVWVGSIGLAFDDDGRIRGVSRSWDPP